MNTCFRLPHFVVRLAVMKKVCKYHKRKGQEYRPHDMVRDFCADAFYVAYPYCLALLYGADKNEFAKGKVYLCCPNPKGVTFTISRAPCRPFYLKIGKKILQWFAARLLYPLSWDDWHIEIKVTGNRGGCPAGFSAGKTYSLNQGRLDELCPASFYALYPHFLASALGHSLPWQKQGMPANIHCPDPEGMVYNLETRLDKEQGLGL